jgi:hypothetical protein
MIGHPSFWAELSIAPQRPSSMQTPPRSVSLSRTIRSSCSRTVYYIPPLIHRRHTCPKRQQQWPRRRRRTEGGRTRLASHLKRQSTLSTPSDRSTTTSSLQHFLLRKMTLAYRRSSVPLVRISSIRLSAMLDWCWRSLSTKYSYQINKEKDPNATNT